MDTYPEIELRQCKYLNNSIGQDHRAIKRLISPMLGSKTFRCARIIIAGIEIMHMIWKAAHAEGLQRDVVCRPVLPVGRTNPSCLRGGIRPRPKSARQRLTRHPIVPESTASRFNSGGNLFDFLGEPLIANPKLAVICTEITIFLIWLIVGVSRSWYVRQPSRAARGLSQSLQIRGNT